MSTSSVAGSMCFVTKVNIRPGQALLQNRFIGNFFAGDNRNPNETLATGEDIYTQSR